MAAATASEKTSLVCNGKVDVGSRDRFVVTSHDGFDEKSDYEDGTRCKAQFKVTVYHVIVIEYGKIKVFNINYSRFSL